MTSEDRKSSIFSGPGRPGTRKPAGESSKPSPSGQKNAGKGGEARKPARPMAEFDARLAKEAAKGSKRSLRQRIAGAMPFFGLFGIREIGLGITLAGAITLMGIWHQYFIWGVLVTIVGIAIMRYGEAWVKRD